MLETTFNALDEAGIAYCVLHGYESMPNEVPSDVDVIVAVDDMPHDLAELLFETAKRVDGELVQWLQHESSAHYAVLASLSDIPGKARFLKFDASTDYRRNGRVFFSGEEILRDRRRFRNFWIPSSAHELAYYLVKRIAKGSLSNHHEQRLSEIFARDPGACREMLSRFWDEPSKTTLANAAQTGDWSAVQSNLVQLRAVMLRRSAAQEPLQAIGYFLANVRRLLGRMRWPTGLMVVVLGPDGSGKSSVIEGMLCDLAPAFRRTSSLHFSPSLLRGRGDSNPVIDPHGVPTRPLIASMAKLGYWFLDFSLGYVILIRPALTRSTLVVFDRYLYDALVDPLRYRFAGPRWALKFLSRLVPKPDLVILLDAPPEILQGRKQEVPFAETKRQRDAYLALVGSLPHGYVIDAAQPLNKVIGQVNKVILSHLAERTARRLKLHSQPRQSD